MVIGCPFELLHALYDRKFSSGIKFRRFRRSNFLTQFNSWLIFIFTTTSVGLEISMHVKMNDEQKSYDQTIEEQTSDDRCLTKINSWRTAWRSLLTKFFADKNFLLYSRSTLLKCKALVVKRNTFTSTILYLYHCKAIFWEKINSVVEAFASKKVKTEKV